MSNSENTALQGAFLDVWTQDAYVTFTGEISTVFPILTNTVLSFWHESYSELHSDKTTLSVVASLNC